MIAAASAGLAVAEVAGSPRSRVRMSEAKAPRFGVFGTTLIAFFLLEMGDKTQIATVALVAKYKLVRGMASLLLFVMGVVVLFGVDIGLAQRMAWHRRKLFTSAHVGPQPGIFRDQRLTLEVRNVVEP